jgi:diadenylate cyclase
VQLSDPQSWTLQTLILGAGIYAFLRFTGTTRGSGVLRGLTYAFLLVGIGVWGLAKLLQLEELGHILEGVVPYLLIMLAILFQPELRRGMERLGQQNRVMRLLSSGRRDMVATVAGAAQQMAARRHGALIAFEQQQPLESWTGNAQRIDAQVSSNLLESIFHPGSALHDGGVVISGDRIVAAACLFPLSDNVHLPKSTGTRHRAALGLTEETDAVTLVVSEETGQISIARGGLLSRDITEKSLEQSLRDALGVSGPEHPESRPLRDRLATLLRGLFREDVALKLGAFALATGIVYVAHQDLIDTREYRLQVVELAASEAARPQGGLLRVRMPDTQVHLERPSSRDLVLVVSGTQARLDRLSSLGGVLEVPTGAPEGPLEVRLEDIDWVPGATGLELRWKGAQAPRLELQRFDRLTVNLTPASVTVDATELDLHFTARTEELELGQTSVEVEGPRRVVEELRGGDRTLQLEPIVLHPADRETRRELLDISPELAALGVRLVSGERVPVTLPIVPQPVALGELERDVAIVNLRPNTSSLDPAAFTLDPSAQKVRFLLNSAGVFDSPAGSEAYQQTYRQLREFAAAHLKAYVDVSEVGDGGGVARIHWDFPTDWKEQLFPGSVLDAAARLEVSLQGEAEVLVSPR